VLKTQLWKCSWTAIRRVILVLVAAVLCRCAAAQQPQPPEDPEDEKKIGLWLDQPVSVRLSESRSLEFEFHERLDEGASNLFEYFGQGGIAFRLRPWFTVTPIYRYSRYPGNPTTAYENRLILNLMLSRSQGKLRPGLRTLIEGRFPDNRIASARLRFRPGVEYTLPFRKTLPPVLVVNDEVFFVPGTNSFSAGGSFTQNRFQAGVRVPLANSVSVRPYYMIQSVNLPAGWDRNNILGLSLAFRFDKSKRASKSGL
jgi:hypothetical protein